MKKILIQKWQLIVLILLVLQMVNAEISLNRHKIDFKQEKIEKLVPVKGKGETQYILISDEIQFCGKNFEVLRTKSLKNTGKDNSVIFSNGGNFLLVSEEIPNEQAEDISHRKDRKTFLMDCNGKEIWSREEIYDTREAAQPIRMINDANGNLFEFDTKNGTLYTIDTNENMINSITLFPDLPYRHDLFSAMEISKDNKYLYIISNRQSVKKHDTRNSSFPNKQVQKAEPTIFLFDENGSLLRKQVIDGDDVVSSGWCNNDNLLFFTAIKPESESNKVTTFIWNTDFEEMLQTNSAFIKCGVIENSLFAIVKGNFITEYDLDTKDMTFKKQLDNQPFELTIDDKYEMILLTCFDKNASGGFEKILMDLAGNEIDNQNIRNYRYLNHDIFYSKNSSFIFQIDE